VPALLGANAPVVAAAACPRSASTATVTGPGGNSLDASALAGPLALRTL
jgi:hypothetical protein